MAVNQENKRKGKARGIYLADDLYDWLKAQAKADKRPLSGFVAMKLAELKEKSTKKSK